MAQNKEHLQALLKFLDSLLKEPGNEWFIEELQKMVGCSNIQKGGRISQDYKIHAIEKYLGLDFNVDTMESVIDYSFVSDVDCRNRLTADNREMLRYRYGVRSHIIDFEEFCRYATMQVELLLNYYYSNQTSDINKLKDLIKSHFENARLDSANSANEIPLAAKLIAYTNQYGLKDVYTTLSNAREVRNSQSHRGIEAEESDFIYAMRERLKRASFPLSKEGEVEWWNLKRNNLTLYNVFNNTVQNTPDYKRYKFLLWKRRKPFNEVFYRLESLAVHIKDNI